MICLLLPLRCIKDDSRALWSSPPTAEAETRNRDNIHNPTHNSLDWFIVSPLSGCMFPGVLLMSTTKKAHGAPPNMPEWLTRAISVCVESAARSRLAQECFSSHDS